MLTDDDLFKKYGEDIVFLFKGAEPYVEALGSPAGVLIERDGKVLCNECEEWFVRLYPHIKIAHGLTAGEYKEKYGFNDGAPLCSSGHSEMLRQKTLAAFEANPEILQKMAKARAKATKTRARPGYRKIQPKKRMQGLNARDACPEQMLQRYRLLQAKYGNDVGLNIMRKVDSGVEGWAVRHYGSWNAFKEAIGEPVDTSSYAKDKAELIYSLREYVAEHKSLPWNVYTKRSQKGFAHSQAPYINQWGTMNRALLVCGIENNYTAVDGKAQKEYTLDVGWKPDPEYMDAAKRSNAQLQARAMKRLEKKEPVVNSEVRIIKPATRPFEKVNEAVKQKVLEETVDEQIESVIHYGFASPEFQVGPAEPKIKSIRLTDKGKKALGRPITA